MTTAPPTQHMIALQLSAEQDSALGAFVPAAVAAERIVFAELRLVPWPAPQWPSLIVGWDRSRAERGIRKILQAEDEVCAPPAVEPVRQIGAANPEAVPA